MKLSVQIPLKTESENTLRSLPFAVANAPASKRMGMAIGIANRVKKQRAAVRLVLDSQLPRLPKVLLAPAADVGPYGNFYRVRLIRISAGVLDDDGLRGALKAVRDEVAAWLGVDDGPRAPVRFAYAQQKGPAKVYAIRIEIEDDDPDPREVHRIVGPPIARLGPVMEEGAHPIDQGLGGKLPPRRQPGSTVGIVARGLGMTEKALRTLAPMKCRALDRSDKRVAEQQTPLVFRRAFYALPEEQTADELTLRELTALPGGDEPPDRLRIAGRLYVGRLETDPALGEFWIYEAAPSAAPASEERAST